MIEHNKTLVYNDVINELLIKYAQDKIPLKISIRSLTNEFDPKSKQLHNFHKYPAKLLYNIPRLLINNDIFSKKNDIVLDPFCGSGTTLLEANIFGRNAIGIDSNPLAILLSEVKTTRYQEKKVLSYLQTIIKNDDTKKNNDLRGNELKQWFHQDTYAQLFKIYSKIIEIQNVKYKRFFLLCFSQVMSRVSLADPRVYVPVKLKIGKYTNEVYNQKVIDRLENLKKINIKSIFEKSSLEAIDLYAKKRELIAKSVWTKTILSDLTLAEKKLNSVLEFRNEKVDLIITSPPYAGAQKYIRSSKLSLLWFGYHPSSLNEIDHHSIGRESVLKSEINEVCELGISEVDNVIKKIYTLNPSRAAIAFHYIKEMRIALKLMVNRLNDNKFLIIVVGNNNICGLEFKNNLFMEIILDELGMQLELVMIDSIKSFALMTKRNFTSNIIKEEYILVFKKVK